MIAGDERREVVGETVAVVPPGDSEIEMPSAGVVVRVFSNAAADLLARCRNADTYVEPDPNVAPFAPWPDRPAGHGSGSIRSPTCRTTPGASAGSSGAAR